MEQKRKFILAGDIGYSNLKGAWGYSDDDKCTSIIRPATAGPRESMPSMSAGTEKEPAILVLVDDEQWATCVPPGEIEGWSRELHHAYPSTKAYKALFYSLLQMTGERVVDKFVTGLPVKHWQDKKYVENLEQLIIGTHQITKGRTVEVKEVEVLPQPAGAFFKFMIENATEEQIRKFEQGFVAVLDPGYFSSDWCGFFKQGLRRHSAGTSLNAMSKLIEKTNELIHVSEGSPSTMEAIENALQTGEKEVLAGRAFIELSGFVKEAKEHIADKAVVDMVSAFRDEPQPAMIIMAGGGGKYYKGAAEQRFPDSEIVSVSPTGIAEGFWQRGVSTCQME